MRLSRVALKGVTRFDREIEVDFSQLGKIVAVVGKNGSGKTTLLEAVPAALYRRLPSRPGSLYDHTHGDAYAEATFGGIVARTVVDADRRQTESYLYVDGAPVVNGKAADYAAKVDELFGSQSLFLSSVFACQTKAGSFLSLPKAERKGLLIELLGLERLEELSRAARALASQQETAISEAKGALAALGDPKAELARATEAVETMESDAFLADTAAEMAATAEKAAREIYAQMRSIVDSAAAAREEHRAARLRAENATAAWERERRAWERERAAARERVDQAVALRQRAAFSHEAALARLDERRSRATKLTAGEAEAHAASRRLAVLEGELALREQGQALYDSAQQHVARADMAHDAVARRLDGLRSRALLLPKVPCTQAVEGWVRGEHATDRARPQIAPREDLAGTCPLLKDANQAKGEVPEAELDEDHTAALLEEATRQLALMTGRLSQLRTVDTIKADYRETAQLAASLPAIRQARQELTEVEAERASAVEQWLQERARLEASQAEAAAAYEALPAQPPDGEPEISAAAQWLRETEERLRAVLAEERDLSSVEHSVINTTNATLAARQAAQAAQERATRAQARLEAAQAAIVKADAFQAAQDGARQELAEYALLAEALGRDGVQALEIDAVGPSIASICNDLLDACYGSRFRIEFATLREKKTGGLAESFDVKVYDGGREALVENLSGGERTIVSEALGLAIAVLNARRSSVHWETLWRDETAGALDPDAAQAYVEMLRRAADVGGFRQVIFVSHSPDVWARADSRVVLENGGVRIE